MDRELLYRRIDARVEAMVARGAADEVCRAHAAGASPSARQALGFEELLRGDVAAMQQRTRRYAKRQLTWLRKLPGAHHVDLTDRTPDDAARDVLAMIPDHVVREVAGARQRLPHRGARRAPVPAHA